MVNAIASAGVDAVGETSRTKLRNAVREFEAMLIADLLKMADQDKPAGEAGVDSYDDMRRQAMAMGMSANGGLGIGKMLLNQLDRSDIKAFSQSADPLIAGDK